MKYPFITFAIWLRIRGYGVSVRTNNMSYRTGFQLFGVTFELVRP